MFSKYKDKMFCFSPPVMLATLLIEFSLAAYTVWRYKMDTVKKLAVTMLVALGLFQLAEYMVCGGLGISGIDWARFGYVSITLLPALGIHMLHAIAGKKAGAIVKTAYATCAAFVLFYIIGEGALNGHACLSNYAVFHTARSSVIPFGLYYYGWMFIGIYQAWIWSNEMPKHRRALQAMAMGYASFILPTTAFNIIDPTTTHAIPSIMCGFAVIFAVVLVTKVLPNSCTENNTSTMESVLNKLRIKI
ncbi:MAG: hypothetical protein WA087_02860 [Candidatus Saccharimonadales bacterium]